MTVAYPWGGGPPLEIVKIVLEIWGYLPEVYTFEEESEIQEIFSKKLWKSQFSIEILIKKSQNFLAIFQNSLHFCPNAQAFAGTLLSFSCLIEILYQISTILLFYINSSRFSQKISTIFMPFSIVLLYLSYFWGFFINFSIRY